MGETTGNCSMDRPLEGVEERLPVAVRARPMYVKEGCICVGGRGRRNVLGWGGGERRISDIDATITMLKRRCRTMNMMKVVL